MFWGKNIKSGETYSFDTDKSVLEQNLNITNISLSEGLDNTKYFLKIVSNGQTYQLCSLDKKNDSITSSLCFIVKKGMKLAVKGGNKGVVSVTGFVENFNFENEDELEEINTDNIKEKKAEKKEIVPQLKKEETKKEKIRINNGIEKEPVMEKGFKKFRKSKNIKKTIPKLQTLNDELNSMQIIKKNSIKNESNISRLKLTPNLIGSRVEDFTIDSPFSKNKIKYTFNIFEIFLNTFFCCFLTKNMRLKRELNLKANSLLNYNLDIVFFTRNMILLDILGKILIDQDKKNIVNFLSRPILYSKKEIESENDGFYNNYSEDDFYHLFDEIKK